MTSEAHLRIDAARDPRKNIDRKPRASLTGTFTTPYPPGTRDKVTAASYTLLASGRTTDEIGAQFNVPGSTVRFWLLNDPQAEEARLSMIEHELARTGEQLRVADEPLSLARAREEARYWMWIAERRISRLYGQKQELTVTLKDGWAERLRRARERVIENGSQESVAQTTNAAPLLPDASRIVDVEQDK
jgi:hypothetical protein